MSVYPNAKVLIMVSNKMEAFNDSGYSKYGCVISFIYFNFVDAARFVTSKLNSNLPRCSFFEKKLYRAFLYAENLQRLKK